MGFSYENKGTNSFLTFEFDQSDTIDRFALGMLTNNKIPGLADAYYTNVNNRELLKYNISSRVTARNYLSGVVTKKRVLSFLHGIANAAQTMEEYMLDADMLLLDLDYIFTDVKTGETSMIFLPRVGAEHKDMADFFRELIFSMQYSQEENSSYVTALMNHINRTDRLVLSEFLTLLAQLDEHTGKPIDEAVPKKTQTAMQPSSATTTQSSAAQAQPALLAQTPEHPEQAHSIPQEPVEIKTPVAPRSEQDEDVKNGNAKEKVQKSEKKGFFLWGNKSKNSVPKQESQKKSDIKKGNPVNYGFSVPGMEQQPRATDDVQPEPASQAPSPIPQMASYSPQAREGNPAEQRTQPRLVVAPVALAVAEHELPQLAEETMPLYEESDETVIMGQEGAGNLLTPQLIRKRNNEQILITKPLFRIGRDDDFNDYAVIGNRHVGHTHCHIVSRDGEYFVVDDNSKNHTRVNGETILPGTEYKLAHGYTVTAADEEFEFKLF